MLKASLFLRHISPLRNCLSMQIVVNLEATVGTDGIVAIRILKKTHIWLFESLPMISFVAIARSHYQVVHCASSLDRYRHVRWAEWRISRFRALQVACTFYYQVIATLFNDALVGRNFFVHLRAPRWTTQKQDKYNGHNRVPNDDEINGFLEAYWIIQEARCRWADECTKSEDWRPQAWDESISFETIVEAMSHRCFECVRECWHQQQPDAHAMEHQTDDHNR